MLDEHFPNSLIARYYGVNVVHSKMLDEHLLNSLITRYYGVNVVHSNGRVWRRYRFTLDNLGKAVFGIDFNHNLGVFMLAGHDTTREENLTVLGDDLTPSAEQQRSLNFGRTQRNFCLKDLKMNLKNLVLGWVLVVDPEIRKYEISLTPNSIHKDGLKIDVAYSGTMSPLPVELVFKRSSE
ncbi:cytochrome P450 [Gigaspora margarita]|uniref:Cytochrome P450 n=1 Tax=Gigaspora margarita TaxID=4874 RepID=A0A8H4EMB6_GIGMA|nr:cytochrome P450 [Gigaspora margarita]